MSDKNLTSRIDTLIEEELDTPENLDEGVVSSIKALGSKGKEWVRRQGAESKIIPELLSDKDFRRGLDRKYDRFRSEVESDISDWLKDKIEDMDMDRSELGRSFESDLTSLMIKHFLDD